MAATGPTASDGTGDCLHPSAWLMVPTVALLFGQAVAAAPWTLPPAAGAGLALPLGFIFSTRRRRWALLVLLSGLAFFLGYGRHRALLFPEFPANHLRSIMVNQERLYIEGRLRHAASRSVRIRQRAAPRSFGTMLLGR